MTLYFLLKHKNKEIKSERNNTFVVELTGSALLLSPSTGLLLCLVCVVAGDCGLLVGLDAGVVGTSVPGGLGLLLMLMLIGLLVLLNILGGDSLRSFSLTPNSRSLTVMYIK